MNGDYDYYMRPTIIPPEGTVFRFFPYKLDLDSSDVWYLGGTKATKSIDPNKKLVPSPKVKNLEYGIYHLLIPIEH